MGVLREVDQVKVRCLIVDQSTAQQVLKRCLESFLGKSQDFHDGQSLVEAFSVFITNNDQKQIQSQSLVA